MALPEALPLDANGRSIGQVGYDAQNNQFVVTQAAPGTQDPSKKFYYAPAQMQLAGNSGLPANLPSIVQKANAVSTGSVASLAATFGSANGKGNSIVVVCGSGDNGTLTVTDTQGNTYTQAVIKASSTTFQAAIFYAVGIAAGANTVTVADTSSNSMAMEIYEVSGLLAQVTSQPDQTSSATGTGTAASAGVIAPSSPNALAFMGVAVGTTAEAVTANAGTPWTADASLNPLATVAGLFSLGSLSAPLSTLSPITPQATIAASKTYTLVAAIFKPVVVGVSGTWTSGGYNYTNITDAATHLVKTGPGVLHAIVVNTAPASGGTLEIDDALTNTTPKIGTLTSPATIGAIVYDTLFTTGLSITTGTHAGDYTVVWK